MASSTAPNRPPSMRRCVTCAECSSCLSFSGHGMAVQDRRRTCRRTGHAEQHRRHHVRRRRHRSHAQQEGEGRELVHVESERQQQRHADKATKPRDDTQDQTDDDASEQEEQTHRIGHDDQRVERVVTHHCEIFHDTHLLLSRRFARPLQTRQTTIAVFKNCLNWIVLGRFLVSFVPPAGWYEVCWNYRKYQVSFPYAGK